MTPPELLTEFVRTFSGDVFPLPFRLFRFLILLNTNIYYHYNDQLTGGAIQGFRLQLPDRSMFVRADAGLYITPGTSLKSLPNYELDTEAFLEELVQCQPAQEVVVTPAFFFEALFYADMRGPIEGWDPKTPHRLLVGSKWITTRRTPDAQRRNEGCCLRSSPARQPEVR